MAELDGNSCASPVNSIDAGLVHSTLLFDLVIGGADLLKFFGGAFVDVLAEVGHFIGVVLLGHFTVGTLYLFIRGT